MFFLWFALVENEFSYKTFKNVSNYSKFFYRPRKPNLDLNLLQSLIVYGPLRGSYDYYFGICSILKIGGIPNSDKIPVPLPYRVGRENLYTPII